MFGDIWLSAVSKKKKSARDVPVLIFLYVISFFYRAGLLIRRLLYAVKIFKKREFAAKIISIGNITMGGTGKTPFTEEFAKRIIKNEQKVAVVAKGYGRQKINDIDIVSEGRGLLLNSRNAGDEPFLIARNVKKAAVIVGKSKIKAVETAVEKEGPDVVLLDDGFQKRYAIPAAVNIVLINALNPLGYNRLFPAGTLREPASGLKDAEFVVVTNTNLAGRERVEAVKKLALKYNSSVKIFESEHQPRFFYNVFNGEKYGLGLIKNRKVISFSSLGNPYGFEKTLKILGARIIAGIRFRDHHRLRRKEAEAIEKLMGRTSATAIVTTEKDEVKLPRKYFREKKVYALKINMLIRNIRELEKRLRLQ